MSTLGCYDDCMASNPLHPIRTYIFLFLVVTIRISKTNERDIVVRQLRNRRRRLLQVLHAKVVHNYMQTCLRKPLFVNRLKVSASYNCKKASHSKYVQ